MRPQEFGERGRGRGHARAQHPHEPARRVVEVEDGGGFTLTAGDDQVDGTWQRDGDEVSIATDQPFFFSELTYQGATDNPDQLTVIEDGDATGVFDVDIDGDQVTFTQTEYGDGEPANPEYPVVYTCTKQ